MLDKILSLSWLNDGKSDFEEEFEEYTHKRKWERGVVKSAMDDWMIQSGLAELFFKQTEEDYGSLGGIEQWPPKQHQHYLTTDFDPRREDHQEIKDFVNGEYDDIPEYEGQEITKGNVLEENE